MNRQRRTPTLGDTPLRTARGSARDRLRDASSRELVELAKKLGNGPAKGLVGDAAGKRDALLEFIERRLADVKKTQRAEQDALLQEERWFRRVGRREPGFTLPDPTRWRRTAQLYKRATDALCAGDLGRGAHLLDQAVAAERAAFATVPKQVDVPDATRAPASLPDERPFVVDGETCERRSAPEVLRAADDIVKVCDTSEPVHVPESAKQHKWWEVEPEEEEQKKGAKGGEKKEEKKGGERAENSEHAIEPKREESAEVEVEVARPAGVAAPKPKKPKKTDG